MAKPRSRRAGFTLVELLIVLVIVGVTAGVVVVNIGGDDRRTTEREAKRLAGALEHVAALAQWSGQTLGVSAEGRSYRFWQRGDDDRWAAFAGDDVLLTRMLPGEMIVVPLSYAGGPLPANTILPFRASGRNEPYALVLSTSAWSAIIAADPLNRVQIADGAAVASR
jgi:general secretion pathway protein H